jgi:hypothetical protein
VAAAESEAADDEKLSVVQVSSDRGASPDDLCSFMNCLAPLGVVIQKK